MKVLDVQAAVEQIGTAFIVGWDGEKDIHHTWLSRILTDLVAEKWTATALRKRAEMTEALVAEKDREFAELEKAGQALIVSVKENWKRAEQAEAALVTAHQAANIQIRLMSEDIRKAEATLAQARELAVEVIEHLTDDDIKAVFVYANIHGQAYPVAKSARGARLLRQLRSLSGSTDETAGKNCPRCGEPFDKLWGTCARCLTSKHDSDETAGVKG